VNIDFPQLRNAEKWRTGILGICTLIPIVGILLALYFSNSILSAIVGFLTGGVFAYFAMKFLYSISKVTCPVCGSPSIQENYANAYARDTKGVEHKCMSCNRKFIDGVLLDDPAT
jgi:hypothetical protein